MININASDHGAGGSLNTASILEAGTYPCTLTAAQMYKNNKYQSEEEVNQVTLIWDTGHTIEADDGNEYPVYIHDSFLTFSFNEKANLTARLKALGFDITPTTNVQLKVEGITSLTELEHHKIGREARRAVEAWEIDGENIFGRQALVAIDINDKGYPKVKSVSAPIKNPGAGKIKPRTAAPTGAPV